MEELTQPRVQKQLGDAAFAGQNYAEAVRCYSLALNEDPGNPVLYSNRSAALASAGRYLEALEDAEKAILLKPEWARGYARKALAQFYLGSLQEALESYSQAQALEPENTHITQSLSELRALIDQRDHPFTSLLSDNNLVKIMTHPRTASFFQTQDFHDVINTIRANPERGFAYLKDKRVATVINVLLGTDIFADGNPLIPASLFYKAPIARAPEPNETAADAEKELGNCAYKQRQFQEALEHYQAAHDLNPKNATYLTNMSAVYFEQQNYPLCIQTCSQAIQLGRQTGTDISKALTRQADACAKLGKFDEAVELYQQSLRECYDDKVKIKLKAAKMSKSGLQDAEKKRSEAEDANSAGNQLFNRRKYQQALEMYTKAVECSPQDSKLWFNRAACCLKMGDYSTALSDISQCLSLSPDNSKALFRKALILARMGLMDDVETVLQRIETVENPHVAAKKRQELQAYIQTNPTSSHN